jgi:hypothetical protein
MKRGLGSGGYTIIEVMIVLAVTAALFISTALLLTGKQGKTQFEQGVNDFSMQLESVMSDVGASYYTNGFTCTATAPGKPVLSAPPKDAGSNEGCVFLGKVLYRTNNTSLSLIDVVGRRDSMDLPTVFPNFDSISMVRAFTIKYGIELRKIQNLKAGGGALSGIAFYNDLGGSSATSSGLNRSAVRIYGLNGGTATDAITYSASTYLPLPDGVVFCLADGAQNAEVTIGANASDGSITSSINTSAAGRCAP